MRARRGVPRPAVAVALALALLGLVPPCPAAPAPARRIVVDGLPVYLQPTDAAWVNLRAYVRAGRSCVGAERGNLAELTAAWMAAGGTESLPAAEFDAAAEALGTRLEVRADRDLLVVDLAVDAGRLHSAARLFADLLMYPAFDPGREALSRANAAHIPVVADTAGRQIRSWLDLPPPEPARGGPKPLRSDVVAFHRDHVGVDTTVVVMTGPMEIDPEREIRSAFLGFRRAAAACPARARPQSYGRRASVAAHGSSPGQARVLVARTGVSRSDPDWLATLAGLFASGMDDVGARLEQGLDEPDLLWYERTVASAAVGMVVSAAERRFRDARNGNIPASALSEALLRIERTLLPPPDAANAAQKHALLEALGGVGEDPAARLAQLRALDRIEVSRALARHFAATE